MADISKVTLPSGTQYTIKDATARNSMVTSIEVGSTSYSPSSGVVTLPAYPTDFTGATSQLAGAHGLVPAPTTSDTDKYLKGDGTWSAVSGGGGTSADEMSLYDYNSLTSAQKNDGTIRFIPQSNVGVVTPIDMTDMTEIRQNSPSCDNTAVSSTQIDSTWDGGYNIGNLFYFNTKVDVTNYDKIVFELETGSCYGNGASAYYERWGYAVGLVSNEPTTYFDTNPPWVVSVFFQNSNTNYGEQTLDVSSLSGEYYLAVNPPGWNATLKNLALATAGSNLSQVKYMSKTYGLDGAVTQSPISTDANYEVVFSGTADNDEHTEGVGKDSGFLYNPNKDAVTIGSRFLNSTIGTDSFAQGYSLIASGNYSHAEGNRNTASGGNSHAEGYYTTASGSSAHAEGGFNVASGDASHAEGFYTIANHAAQHVFGQYNIADTKVGAASERGDYIEIVGNGSDDGTTITRSNARTLDWSGNEVLAGKLTVGTAPTNNMDVATKQYVDAGDGKVTQSPSTTNADYRILFSATADNTERTETTGKDGDFTYNPSSKLLQISEYIEVPQTSLTETYSNISDTGLTIGQNGFTWDSTEQRYIISSITPSMIIERTDITNESTWDGTNESLITALSNINTTLGKIGQTVTWNSPEFEINSGTSEVALGDYSLAAGKWLGIVMVRWATNSTGRRYHNVYKDSNKTNNYGAIAQSSALAVDGTYTYTRCQILIENGTSANPLYVYGYQNSGGKLKGIIRAIFIRIG